SATSEMQGGEHGKSPFEIHHPQFPGIQRPACLVAASLTLRSNSIRSKNTVPPIAVGAMPVSMNAPQSFHRSSVTTHQSRGTSGETSRASHFVKFLPEK